MSWTEQTISPVTYTEQELFYTVITGPIFQDRTGGPSWQDRTNELWDKTGSRSTTGDPYQWTEGSIPVIGWTEPTITP